VNDAPPASLDHPGRQRPRELQAGREIHLERLVPDLVGELGERHRREHRRVVEEDVDLSHRLHGLRGQALDLAPPAEIRDDELDTRLEALADVGDRRDQLGLLPARDQDVGARLRETAGHRLPEPAASTGDEGRAPREIERAADGG